MAKIIIVNHPDQEPSYLNKTLFAVNPILWNCTQRHKRKFILRDGLYLDRSNNLVHDELYFWGEYEPYSNAIIINSVSPQAIHRDLLPVMELLPMPQGKHINTDPYVYGCFRNICCGRRREKEYSNGDIIIFGKVIDNKVAIDTVLVVDKAIPVSDLSQTSQYYLAAAQRIFGNKFNNLIEGKMYTPMLTTSFSFVPCLPKEKINGNCINLHSIAATQYKKPILQLNTLGIPICFDARGRGTAIIPSNFYNNIWDAIISAVHKADLELGVYIQPV